MYKQICCKDVKVWSHRDFLTKFADFSRTATQSGYNPLLSDFVNVSFLLSS